MASEREPELIEDGPDLRGMDPGVGEVTSPSTRRVTSSPTRDAKTETRDGLPGVPETERKSESCGPGCGCQSDGSAGEHEQKRAITDGAGAETAGGSPRNADESGELGEIDFTDPEAGASQALPGEGRADPDRPDTRVNLPGDVELDTPEFAIRSQMNDIDTPDEKTWFMELDEAVIDDGRCIQCGTCVAACPSDSIGIGDDGHPELVKMCTGCSLCWDFCPRGGLRYERQWKITGGEENVAGAGDPITEYSAKVTEDWREKSQDGGAVTAILLRLMEQGEIDGAILATESDDEPWKAEGFLATTPEELLENTGTIYNQTMALGHLDFGEWDEKLPDKPWEDISLALVGTPCEIEGIRALQDFEWEYGSQEEGIRAIDYRIALMCTKNFNYERLIGDKLQEERGIDIDAVGKMDVLHGKLMVDDRDGNRILEEDIENFHDAALKGCDECADFTGFCADLAVGSVGSSEEYSSVIVRTEAGLDAWERTAEVLEYHDLEDRSAIGKLQGWDKKNAFESLERPFDPDAPRFIEYTDHVDHYGGVVNPHDTGS